MKESLPIRSGRWAGPVLLTLGVMGIIAIIMMPWESRGTLGWWILSNVLAYQRILPLIGFGFILAFISLQQRMAALVFLASGMALGFIFAFPFLSTVALIPGAAEHHFLIGPVLSLAVGLTLIAPVRGRNWILPFTAIIVGGMFAVAIRLTDPSYRDPTIMLTGIGVGTWTVTAVCLTVRAFRQAWLETASRIFGSWLLAIGLLYGGVSLIPPQIAPPPDPYETSLPPSDPGNGPSSDMTAPGQANPQSLPEGFNPARQP